MVAVSDPAHRPSLLARSLRARFLVWVPSTVLAVLVAPASHRLAAGLMAAAIAVITAGPAVWYPILLIVALIVSVGGYAASILKVSDVLAGPWSEVAAGFARNRAAVATEVAGGAYNSLAVAFVGASAMTAQAAA